MTKQYHELVKERSHVCCQIHSTHVECVSQIVLREN